MAYNRYDGNTGKVTRMPDHNQGQNQMNNPYQNQNPRNNQNPTPIRRLNPDNAPIRKTPPVHTEPKTENKPLTSFAGIGKGLSGLISKVNLQNMETEDIILMLMLYLMYRDSKDMELLVIMGCMLFL